jgi:hypothetical protein
MIGRVEVFEILGMAGTCAALLFAGFSVETLEGNVSPSWAATVEVQAPDVRAVELPDEVRLERPVLERPVHPAPPVLSLDPDRVPVYRPSPCGCRHVIS